jgi:hypothetical protein
MAETSWRMEEYAGEMNKIIEYSGLKYESSSSYKVLQPI